MANPTFVSAGTKAVGTTGTVTATMPASIAAGDLLVLVAHQATGTTVSALNTANGFTLLAQRAGTSCCIGVWWKIAVGSDSAPIVAAASNATLVTVLHITSPNTVGNPFVTPGVGGALSGTNLQVPAITATAVGSLILYIVGVSGVDSNTSPFTAFTDATMSGTSLAAAMNTLSGSGAGLGIGEGNTTSAAGTGVGAFTNATSVTSAPYLVIEFPPSVGPPKFTVENLLTAHPFSPFRGL